MGNILVDGLHLNPIIAAINDQAALDSALESGVEFVFLLTGNIFNVKDTVDKIHGAGKKVCIHIDLMEGISHDEVGMRYLIEIVQPDGIITTKGHLIRVARNMGVLAIQRLFILDSLNLQTGIQSVKSNRPDAVEILPGVMPKITKLIAQQTKRPIITGGLIMDKEDVIASLQAGAMGISTSKVEIWDM